MRDALGASVELTVVSDWVQFASAAPAACAAVAVVPWLEDTKALLHLAGLRYRGLAERTILVTSSDPPNTRRLSGFDVGAVLWLGELSGTLAATVARICGESPLAALARDVQHAQHLPKLIRGAIQIVCTTTGPIPTQAGLAQSLGKHRSTLWDAWQAAVPNLKLKELLEWVTLFRALERRNAGASWLDVATSLGLHEDTIERAAGRLLHRKLAEVAAGQAPECYQIFRQQVTALLLRHVGSDN